jgi:hypothetical protein
MEKMMKMMTKKMRRSRRRNMTETKEKRGFRY